MKLGERRSIGLHNNFRFGRKHVSRLGTDLGEIVRLDHICDRIFERKIKCQFGGGARLAASGHKFGRRLLTPRVILANIDNKTISLC
jgi:hypothetical protein